MAAKRPTTFSMRMPEDLNEKINAYAAEHKCTKAEAMTRFARAGIELEESGGMATAGSGVPDVGGGSQETLAKIEERLEALQNLPTIEPIAPTSTAIVPIDIREKIQAYSKEHDCSEQDAMAYYARLGVQLSGETRAATTADLAELHGKLDALAQDSRQKGEQLAQLADAIAVIREYTQPETLELEGEIADDAEDVELSEEELQRMADERTRQIVSDVLSEYATQQRAEREEELQRASEANASPRFPLSIIALFVSIIAVFAAIIAILLRG